MSYRHVRMANRTQRRNEQRDRLTEVYGQIVDAVYEVRRKGNRRAEAHLTAALRSISEALDILNDLTASTRRWPNR